MLTNFSTKLITIILLSSFLLIPNAFSNEASAQIVPEWVKNTAKWWAEGLIPEQDFLNTIKFLIEHKILVLEQTVEILSEESDSGISNVIIPNGNALQSNIGFYVPINLQIKVDTVVEWKNEDDNGHTVQSQDSEGNVIPIFNSNVLQTGDTFQHKFTESGEFHYFCTIHPWRIGVITVG